MLSSRTEMKRGQIEPFRGLFARIEPVGSVALKLALVAAARADLWISAAPKSEWDVCAGDLLVREAGGRLVELARGERSYNQRDVLLQPLLAAGPPGLVEEFGGAHATRDARAARRSGLRRGLPVSDLLIGDSRRSASGCSISGDRSRRPRARHADRRLHARGRPPGEETTFRPSSAGRRRRDPKVVRELTGITLGAARRAALPRPGASPGRARAPTWIGRGVFEFDVPR
jgi:hypothetical protein